jgi:hypothetical protein
MAGHVETRPFAQMFIWGIDILPCCVTLGLCHVNLKSLVDKASGGRWCESSRTSHPPLVHLPLPWANLVSQKRQKQQHHMQHSIVINITISIAITIAITPTHKCKTSRGRVPTAEYVYLYTHYPIG